MSPAQRIYDETVLLDEYHHRLFNMLQIIAMTVSHCRREADDRLAPVLLKQLEDRVYAFGALHRMLSMPAPTAGLDDHFRTLCLLLLRAFGRDDITPWVAMEDLDLSADQAQRLPLLVVELVTNVLKHSLADQQGGVIWVDLHARRGHVELSVSDSRTAPGPIFPPSRIVTALARGLHGEAFVKNAGGWVAGALFPFRSAARDMTLQAVALRAATG
jgi:two-component sensor histidine kinase